MTVDELVVYLVTGGAVMVSGWFLSWALEDWTFWQGIGTKGKKFLILCLSLVLAMGGVAYTQLPVEIQQMIAPYLAAAILTISTWLSTQVAHNNNPKRL